MKTTRSLIYMKSVSERGYRFVSETLLTCISSKQIFATATRATRERTTSARR
jgi:hypothetical protein